MGFNEWLINDINWGFKIKLVRRSPVWTFGRNNGANDLVSTIISPLSVTLRPIDPPLRQLQMQTKNSPWFNYHLSTRRQWHSSFPIQCKFCEPRWSQSAALSMLTRIDAVIVERTPRSTWRSIYFLWFSPPMLRRCCWHGDWWGEESRAILRVHHYSARFKFTSQNWFSCPGIREMAFAVNPSGISIRWFAILFGSLDANQNAIDFGLSVIKKFSFGAR